MEGNTQGNDDEASQAQECNKLEGKNAPQGCTVERFQSPY